MGRRWRRQRSGQACLPLARAHFSLPASLPALLPASIDGSCCRPAEVESKVLEAEATFSHWSLFNRFVMAAQMLDAADAAGASQRGRAWAGAGRGPM